MEVPLASSLNNLVLFQGGTLFILDIYLVWFCAVTVQTATSAYLFVEMNMYSLRAEGALSRLFEAKARPSGERRRRLAAGLPGAVLVIISCAPQAIGQSAPTMAAHASLDRLKWTKPPGSTTSEAVLYASKDGRRVAAAFRESGSETFKFPFDEFIVVTSGRTSVSIHGGAHFNMRKGDLGYFTEGTVADFKSSKDYSEVVMLTADHPVKWR